MDRRRAGALLALAACIATTAAAPTASNQTALDLYEGASEGCYYNFQHYGEGDRIMTNEPCLNCTCHNRMLMCYLRVCPFTKPIGQDCSVEKRADQCCPIVTCPDVPVDLLTSTSTTSPAEYGETGLGKLDRYGCSINGKYFPEGSKVPPTPNKPCEHCYCIRNMTTCVMQECTLHVDGCTPIYRKDVCCPVRYSCDHPEDEIPLLDDMTTTVRPTPGFLLTTTTLPPVTQITQDCVHDDKIFPDGALIKTEKACEHCYCMKGDIVCVVQECGTPMENEGKNCTSMPPREGQCCPDTYICEGDEITTEPKLDIATVTSSEDITTLSPPRRVSVEGSGYRSETDEPFTEAPTFEPDTEGSGEEQPSYKPTDKIDMLIPENETSPPSVTTEKDEIVDQNIPTATVMPVIETEMTEKVTTEPDKGENTVPSDSLDQEKIFEQESTPGSDTTSKMETVTELATQEETTALPKDESHAKDDIIPQEETTTLPKDQTPAIEDITRQEETTALPKDETHAIDDITRQDETTALPKEDSHAIDDITRQDETTALPKDESHAIDDITQQEETTALPEDETHAADDITRQDETTAVPKDESHAIDDITQQEETTALPKDESTKDDITTQEETTAIPKDESAKDDITPQEESAVTKPTSIAETTIDDHKAHTSLDGMESTEHESFETTVPTRRKEDKEKPSVETTTLKDLEDFTTKPSDLTGTNTLNTESTTSFVEQEAQTSPTHMPEKDNEVLIQEPTTESNLELTTKSDGVKSETGSITTVQPEVAAEVATSAKVDTFETTSANPIENEIDEESFLTPVPGRIPGEGDCLLDGVTYSHESVVPSSNNCHTSCRCISSIVKCEPVICSPPPDYMDNCQPMYDTPESCCPTYVCDHPRETVPPQSHSQMAGTESPVPTPTIECDGDQCEVVKDKEPVKPASPCSSVGCTDELSNKPDDCGPQGCSEAENKQKEPHLSEPEECVGNSCSSTPEQCSNGKCDAAIPKDQTCNSENGCEIPVIQTCEGDNCSVQPDESAIKDNSSKSPHCEGESCASKLPSQTIPIQKDDCKESDNCGQPDQTAVEECKEEGCRRQQAPDINKPVPSECTGSECTQDPQITATPKDQTCNSESGCEIPVIQTCEGDNCSVQPDAIKDSSSIPTNCEGESCVSELPSQTIPKEKDGCKDSDNCGQTDQTAVEECKEEGCRKQQAPDIDKPASDIPEINTESIPSITELSESTETKYKEPVTDLPTTTAFEKDIEPSKATEASIPEEEEEKSPMSTSLLELATTETTIISGIGTNAEKQTEAPELATSSIQEEHITNPPQVATKHENAVDMTTAEPSLPNVSPEISQKTTESPEMLTLAPESLDRDGHDEPTKEPEYVQDTESKVTEFAEDYTTTPEQQTTSESAAEPIDEQESHGAPTTPKSYSNQNTDEPDIIDTNTSTIPPETQSTFQQEQDKLKPEPSENTSRPDEHVTSKLDAIQTTVSTLSSGSGEGIQTKTTTLDDSEITPKPEVSLDEYDQVTEAPQLITSSDKELTTVAAVHDLVSESGSQTESSESLATLAPETAPQESDILTTEIKHIETPAPVTVQVQTETPMSIVKDHNEEEVNITRAPESEIMTENNELITRKPELPESEVTRSPESEVPTDISDSEKMSTVRAEKPAAATTKASISDLETTISPIVEEKFSTDAPVHDSKVTVISETETSTDNLLSSAAVTAEHPEPFATEREEKTTESAPMEDIVSRVTESSVQSTAEGGYVITTAQVQIDEDTDSTELPELTIHEHPTEPSSIAQEPELSVTKDITSKAPVMAITEPQTISEKDTTSAPISQDVTQSPAERQPEKEVTDVPKPELVTLSPEMFGTETTVSKAEDITSYIPEISPTESQSEASAAPEVETSPTHAPETAATQKEEAEIPVTEAGVTSSPKISETEPQEIVTEGVEVQSPDTVTTDPHKDMTVAPESHDIVTSDSVTVEPQKESTGVTEVFEIEPHKEITNIPETQDITTAASIIPDSATKLPEISLTESHGKGTEKPDSPDEETSAPNMSEAEPQETATKSQSQDVVTTIPESPDTVPEKDVTEAPVSHDIATTIAEVSVTESSPDIYIPVVKEVSTLVPDISEIEPQKETMKVPANEDTSNVPPVYATESQMDVTEAPVAEDKVTNVPDLSITESQTTGSQTPELQDIATGATVSAETAPKKETTEIPELEEAAVTNPEISQTEPEALITDAPDITQTELLEPSTNKPESQDTSSKGPETSATAYETDVTNAPEVQDMVTQILDVAPTKSQQETSEAPETPEKSITESQQLATESPESPDTATNLPEILATESQQILTEPYISPAPVTSAPDIELETESNKETLEQELATPTPESAQSTYKSDAEEQSVTVRDESFTEPPLKITTKLDENAQKEPQESVTPTESSKHEADTSLPTVDGSLVEQSSKAPESLATETSDKIADSDTATDKPADMVTDGEKPEQALEIATEKPSEEPIKIPEIIEPEKSDLTTESSSPPKSFESDTKSPELSITESDVTTVPPVTDKQDYTQAPESLPTDSRRTEATSAPVEEELQSTKTPETPQETSASKDEYPETTPYLVLLEEHTHKKDVYTVSPDEEITTSPSDVSQKDEDSIDKVTESAPSKESEKPLQEDEIANKDVPELTQTTVSEKITESSPVSEEVTTITPLAESFDSEKPQNVESNEISTSVPITDEEPIETEKPSIEVETEKEALATEKPHETTAPEEEFILASTKATTLKVEEEPTTLPPLEDKFGKPAEAPKPDIEAEKPKPDTAEEIPKPNDIQPTEEAMQPEDESHFPPSGTTGYGQEPDYGEEDSFGPGTCRYGGKVYVSAQQIPRDDPCDFCFCFRSDIICLQQSCPPPIHGCHEEPIQGFCCPRYECPVSMATTLNVTTTTTTTTTTLPPHFLPHAYKGAAQRRGCQIKGHTYKVGEVVRASSGPCLHCTCGGDGQMKCDPKVCTPEPMLRQMIAAAVSAKRRR